MYVKNVRQNGLINKFDLLYKNIIYYIIIMEDFNSDDEVFETKEIKINNIEDISSFNQN